MRTSRLPQHPSFSQKAFSQKAFSQNYRYILNRQIKFVVSK